MNNTGKNIILMNGWHDVEGHYESKKSWRWTKNSFYIKIADKLDKLIIYAEPSCIDQEIEISGMCDDQNGYTVLNNLYYEAGAQISLEINVKKILILKIKTNTFVPKNTTIGSDDTRSLGIMVTGMSTIFNDCSEYLKISDISTIDKDDTYCNDKSIYLDIDRYFTRPTVHNNPRNIENLTVILTCHSDKMSDDRLTFGKKAYDSLVSSGIKNIIIVISGNNTQYIRWAKSLSKDRVVIVNNDNVTNNKCWIDGLRLSKTYWSMILHDDDIMLPNIKEAISLIDDECLFGVVQGSVIDSITKKVDVDKTIDLQLSTGKYKTDVIKNLVLQNKLSISPIHGIFPTEEYIKSLEEWSNLYQKDTFYRPFEDKPNFVVGNDYYIWCYFLKNPDEKFLFFNKKCTNCISHDGSSTQIDLRKNKPSFFSIYEKLKTAHIKNNLKVGCVLYINKLNDAVRNSLQNLSEFKMSKYNIPFVIYSDNQLENINYTKINTIEKMSGGYYTTKDKYAFWSFIEAIKIARSNNWDYFFVYEWDCKVGTDYWFDIIWEEHLSWPTEPIITGTPAVRYPKLNIGNFCRILETYSYHYSRECHVSLNVDLASPISLYTNGALTFYNTSEMCFYYKNELESIILDKSSHVDDVGPWDFGLGVRIFKNLKEQSFKRVGWLPSVYSGCGDFCYNQHQRDEMLSSRLKVVIHQNKYEL